MKIEIIAIGNEVLTGCTINTNAAYIAREVQNIGLLPTYQTVVGDDRQAICEALHTAMGRVDVVFCIGGLGPTEDDLTKETVCEALGLESVLHESILEEIKAYFEKIGRHMPLNNTKQACFPKGSIVIPNPNGTAPGCMITHHNKYVVLLPGPPKELKPMMVDTVLPYFEAKQSIIYQTEDIKLFGLGESHLAEIAGDLLGDFGNVLIAPYVGENEIIFRVRARGTSQEQVLENIEKYKKEIVNRLGAYIIGYNESKLEEEILKCIAKKGYTVATAESCTGGLVASSLVNCSGISEYFKEGIITYSNEAKMKYLGVAEETLSQWGAVSEQTAKEMAEGIRRQAGSVIGLATTGIAGPDGGTPTKPVGLVYIAIALGEHTYVKELRLQGGRQAIREKATKHLFYELYLLLQE
ncbi:MAG: competence/damage-inducible protein A [Cellulosilyticaceae bacterium]